jgi:class 3 adenylate cyclase
LPSLSKGEWTRAVPNCADTSSGLDNQGRQRVPFCSQTARPTAAGFGIGIAHGYATIGFEGRFDYAAIGTVSNVASRLCDEAKPGQILISPRVLTKVENVVEVEPVGEFELKGIRRPLAAYNAVAAVS